MTDDDIAKLNHELEGLYEEEKKARAKIQIAATRRQEHTFRQDLTDIRVKIKKLKVRREMESLMS